MIDLGHDHTMEILPWRDDSLSAILVHHRRPADGMPCTHYAPIKGGAWDGEFEGRIETWDMVQRDPLTISPSLLCRVCGDHGFIRDGKWVVA